MCFKYNTMESLGIPSFIPYCSVYIKFMVKKKKKLPVYTVRKACTMRNTIFTRNQKITAYTDLFIKRLVFNSINLYRK